MRVTIHLVSRADYWPLALAIRARAARLVAARSAKGDAAEMRGGGRNAAGGAEGRPAAAQGDRGADRQARSLHGIGSGSTWSASRRRAPGSAAAPTSTGSPRTGSGRRDPRSRTRSDHLVTPLPRPASVRPRRADIANWAGLGAHARSTPALEGLDCALRGRGRHELSTSRARRCRTRTRPRRCGFLPTWDATLLAHARRALILPEEHRARIFHIEMPQSVGTFLVDGAGGRHVAAGRHDRAALVDLDDAPTHGQVDAEAARLAAFIA